MASFNKVILMGNLTRDPQLKFLPSGTPVCEFGLATNRRWTDQATGQQREMVNFIDCQVMGRQAETVSKNFTKGKAILVEGRLDFRQWTAQNGDKRSKHEVFVENFSFVGSGGAGAGGGGPDGGEGEGGAPMGGAPRGGARPYGGGANRPAAAAEEGYAAGGPPTDDVPF